jgi:hypothetical protein
MGAGPRESLLAGLVPLNDRMVALVSLDFLIGANDLRQPSGTETVLLPAA